MSVREIHLAKPPERIAIIKPSALGDIANSLPVLSALRQQFPEAHLAWVVNRSYAGILDGHPDLDEIFAFDRGALRKSWLRGSIEFARLLKRLHQARFDLVIDLQGLFRTGLMTLATGAPVRIGLTSAREGARIGYTHRVNDCDGALHAVDRCWRVIEALGEAPAQKTFHVPIHEEARRWVQATITLAGCCAAPSPPAPLLRWGEGRMLLYPRPWYAVGVGSRWVTKRWPPEHFAALVRQAQAAFGGTAVFIGAPEEAELATQTAAMLNGPTCQLTGKTTLPQLVAVLEACDVLIANDTGPLHVAVALGRPVVAPYTCTLIEKNGPYQQSEHAVATAVHCRGSYLKKCSRMDCMTDLTPARLWPPLETILRQWQQTHHAA